MPEVEGEIPMHDAKLGELVGPAGDDYVIMSAEALRRINAYEQLLFGSGSFVSWYNAGKASGGSTANASRR